MRGGIARRRLAAAASGGVETPPTCLSEDQLLELQLQTVADSSNLSPESRKDRKAKKKRLRKAKAVIDLDLCHTVRASYIRISLHRGEIYVVISHLSAENENNFLMLRKLF